MKSYRTRPQMCPSCGRLLEAMLPMESGKLLDKRVPDPGDFTACAYCASLLVFGPSLELLPFSDGGLAEIQESEPDLAAHLVESQKLLRRTLVRSPRRRERTGTV